MKQNGFLNMFINGVRRFSPALAIAGFMALCSTASAKALQTNNINNNNNSEWFSREASDAISVMSLPINPNSIQLESQKIPIFSKELHEIFKKVADIETVYAFEDNVYGQYGSYIGAALVQMEVYSLAVQAFTSGDPENIRGISEEAYNMLKKDPTEYYGSMRENKDKIDGLVCNTIKLVSEGLKSAYQSGELNGKSGKEVVIKICNILRENDAVDKSGIDIILKIWNCADKETPQREMNAVAGVTLAGVCMAVGNKICEYMLNEIAFDEAIKNVGSVIQYKSRF